MLDNCPKSCESCDRIIQEYKFRQMEDEALNMEDYSSSSSISDLSISDLLDLTSNYGEKQVAMGDKRTETIENVISLIEYMKSDDVQNLPTKFRKECLNRNELCSFWAVIGECEANKSYMKIQCAPACQSCHLIE